MGEVAGKRRNRNAWTVTVLLFLFFMINFADKSILGLAAIDVMRDLELDPVEFGLLGSAFYLLFSISSVAIGFVSTRMPTARLLACMGVLWAVCQFPVGILATFPVLLASRIILGFGEGPAYPMMMHNIASWFPDRQRALPTSIAALGGAVGIGVAAPALTWIIASFGWRWAFVTLGFVGLAWTIAWLFLGGDGPVREEIDTAAGADGGQRRLGWKLLLLNRTVIAYLAAGFLAYSCVAATVVWIPAFLMEGVGFSQVEMGWILVVPAMAQVVLTPLIAALSQSLLARGWSGRMARARLAGLCLVLSGLGLAAMPFAGQAFVVALLGFSLAMVSVLYVLGPVLIAQFCPAAQRGAMLGIANGVHSLAGIVAPAAMGLVIAGHADRVEGFTAAMIMLGATVLTGGIIALAWIDPDKQRERFLMLTRG